MYRRPVVVRRGPGLLGTMAVGGVAYAAGSSKAKSQAQMQQMQTQQQQLAQQQQQLAAQQQQMPAQQQAPPPQAAPAPAQPAALTQDQKIEQLERLSKLKQSGVLNEQEFESQKQKILNQ